LICVFLGKLVFGDETEKKEWDQCFPCELIDTYTVKWPNVLIISAKYDYGLRAQASEFYDKLYDLDHDQDHILDWITVEESDHFSITCQWSYQLSGLSDYVVSFLEKSLKKTAEK
jgi:hypothetical protein